MSKTKLATGLVALLITIGGYIGITQTDLKNVLCDECNTTVECPVCPKPTPCPECNTTADCPEPIVCPEPTPCPECPEVKPCPTVDLKPTYDSNFSGRIVYEDKTPYKRGIVRALGDNWISYALTDDEGKFTVSVKGNSPFTFSAYSPWKPEYISYKKKIKVPEDTNASRQYCTDGNATLDICTDKPTGTIKQTEWSIGKQPSGCQIEFKDGTVSISNGGKYCYVKKPYKYEIGKTYKFTVKVKTIPAGKKWCVAAQGNHGYCSTKSGEITFPLTAKSGDTYIGLFGYGDYTVIYEDIKVTP